MSEQLWWHMYGGTVESDGIWIAVVAGGSNKHPDDVSTDLVVNNALDLGRAELHYLGSFDHEPSEEEKEALTPEKYRDDEVTA